VIIELIYFIDFVKSNVFFAATFHHVTTKKRFANDIKDFELHDVKKSP
jgi:hypothetical protein